MQDLQVDSNAEVQRHLRSRSCASGRSAALPSAATVENVEEKFGGFRIHVSHANDAIRGRIELANEEALHTCEVCGQPGTLREGDWIKTLCDEHAGARGARDDSRDIGRNR